MKYTQFIIEKMMGDRNKRPPFSLISVLLPGQLAAQRAGSDDGGLTCSSPLPTPDGRLAAAFRDMAKTSSACGHYVPRVGPFEDIVNRREGQYRIKLLLNPNRTAADEPGTGDLDCGDSDIELLADGTLIAATCIKYRPGAEKNSVVSTPPRVKGAQYAELIGAGERLHHQPGRQDMNLRGAEALRAERPQLHADLRPVRWPLLPWLAGGHQHPGR